MGRNRMNSRRRHRRRRCWPPDLLTCHVRTLEWDWPPNVDGRQFRAGFRPKSIVIGLMVAELPREGRPPLPAQGLAGGNRAVLRLISAAAMSALGESGHRNAGQLLVRRGIHHLLLGSLAKTLNQTSRVHRLGPSGPNRTAPSALLQARPRGPEIRPARTHFRQR